MFGPGSSSDRSPSERRPPPALRRATLASISRPPPDDGAPEPKTLARRSTSFKVLKAGRNGVSEHAIEIDFGDGRLAGAVLMDQLKELLDPRKPWD